jgi:hypothetical protein
VGYTIMSVNATRSTAVPFEITDKAQTAQDVQAYLIALYSYAKHFAVHRNLTFQKHLQTVLGIGTSRVARRSRRCRGI